MSISLLFLLALIFFILALVLTKKDRTKFLIGIFYTITIILASMALYMLYSNESLVDSIELLIRKVMKYVTYFIAILFIYNGIYNTFAPQKIRRNNITDLFSFLSGITLIMANILTNGRNGIIYIIVDILLFYLDIMFISYVIMSILYKITTKKTEYDILIVLGAGLIEGIRPSKTLANRLNKAIEVYKSSSKSSYIVVSGGKGTDEKISEAEAMKQYLIEHEIEENKIIIEDKSNNTYENLKYSKEKIKEKFKEANLKIAFVSSNFHIYRVSIFARQLNITADGIGAKTLYYYYPNSFIREFAAITVKYKFGTLIYLVFAIFFLVILLTK